MKEPLASVAPDAAARVGGAIRPGTPPGGRKRVLVAFGTRPEAVKLAPVVMLLRRDPAVETISLSTGQHRDLLATALAPFGIVPDVSLDVMQPGQDLTDLTLRLLAAVRGVVSERRPDLVVVQGDTTTTFAAALVAFYAGIPVAHVEAGLRTHDLGAPFPEEANRRLVGSLASLHFAPTEGARRNLRAEGVPDDRIFVTGNTVVDALRHVASLPFEPVGTPLDGVDFRRRLVLVTAHRRENHGAPLERLCAALGRLAVRPDLQVVLPLHPNPNVQRTVVPRLQGVPGIVLLPSLDYLPFVQLLARSAVALTDSGGVQEEAPALGVPVLVFRSSTERPEGVAAGCARVIGTDEESIVHEVERLLDDPHAHAEMSRGGTPYGDGRAAQRIVRACKQALVPAAGGHGPSAGP